jgi:hypothetical protein
MNGKLPKINHCLAQIDVTNENLWAFSKIEKETF